VTFPLASGMLYSAELPDLIPFLQLDKFPFEDGKDKGIGSILPKEFIKSKEMPSIYPF